MKQRRAQYAVAIVFAVHGTVSGNFATRVPWIAERLDLGAGALGLALLTPALGSVLAMPLAGKLVHKHGGRAVTQTAVAAYTAALALPAFMPSLAALCVALLGFGLAAGAADVAMKAQGSSLERMGGRPIMSRLHGMWSIGTLTGAGIGAIATFGHIDARLHLAWIAVALLIVGSATGVALPRPRHFPVESAKPPKFTRPTRALAGIAVIGFCAAFAEAAAHTWSAVYITEITGGSAGAASLGFAMFVACMAVSRMSGDFVVHRLGPVRTVQAGALVAAAGAALVATSRAPSFGLAGFAVLGLGVAVVLPVAVSAAARVSFNPGQGITTLVTIGYFAYLASPGAVGAIGDVISLPAAFAGIVLITVPIAVLATTLRARSETEAVATAPAASSTAPVTGTLGRAVGTAPVSVTYAGSYEPAAPTLTWVDSTHEIPASVRESHTEPRFETAPALTGA